MKQNKGIFKKTIALTAIMLAFLVMIVPTASAVSISAEKTSVFELETVKLTVNGVSGDTIWVNATPSSSHVLFRGGVDDTPPAADGKDNFEHTIDVDGEMTYAVRFNDTGTYKIKVTVIGGPRDGEYDTVEIMVNEKAVIFDVPATVVIGSVFTINGTANTGTYVTVAVDNYVYPDLDQLVLDANKQFSKEIDTFVHPAFQVPGSVRLKAFIDRPKAISYPEKIGPTEIADGSVAILMVRGDLVAELSSSSVAWGDDFTISGKALGAMSVDIVIVSPKGSGGTKIDGTAKSALPGCPEKGQVGIYLASASVSKDNFSKKITVGENVDTGSYLVAVLSPGADGLYGKVGWATLADALCAYSIAGKTQSELFAILWDIADPKLSDDNMWIGYLKVVPCLGTCCNDSGCTDPYATDITCKDCIDMGKYWKPNKTVGCFGTVEPFDLCLNWCPQCCDKVDNDDDGKIDYPKDPQCTCELDPSETEPMPPIPELATIVLLSVGLLVLAGYGWVKRNKN